MGGAEHRNGSTRKLERISLIEARLPSGIVEIMGEDDKPRDVVVYPLSTGAEEEIDLKTKDIAAGRARAVELLPIYRRAAEECAPDATAREIARLNEEQLAMLLQVANRQAAAAAAYIAERRAAENPPPAAATTRANRKGSGRTTRSDTPSSP
jgi:hypothetical protein